MEIDFSKRYKVGSLGVAWQVLGYATEWAQEDYTLVCEDPECIHDDPLCWLSDEPEEIEDHSKVRAVMVGDDREEIIDVDDLTVIPDDGYCRTCGQIGCTHDVYE
jgi:hypothetical protein